MPKGAKEIGVNVNPLYRWVNDYRKQHSMPSDIACSKIVLVMLWCVDAKG